MLTVNAERSTAANVNASGSLLAFDWDEIRTWNYDMVVRYTLAAQLIDRLLTERSGPVTLLDVGCNFVDPWRSLLDAKRVSVVRCDVEPVSNGRNFVLLERDRPLPFADGGFDVVVALEVLEHLPRAARADFLADCFRVSRAGAIWSCPEGRPDVARAESLGDAAFRARHGRAHPFLAEHAEFGPPTRQELTADLEALEAPFALFANSPMSHWLAAMLLGDLQFERDTPKAGRIAINRLLDPAYPVGEAPYRMMAVAARTFIATAALEPLPAGSPGVLLDATPASPGDPVPAALNLLAQLTAQAGSEFSSELGRRDETIDEARRDLEALEAQRAGDSQQSLTLQNFANGVASSWTWKLLAPLRAARLWLGSRRYHREQLSPVWHLEPTDNPGEFRATGDDPQFLLPCTLPAGWVRIDYRIHSEVPSTLEIFLDHGEGFSNATCVERVPIEGTTAHTRFLYLPERTRALRLDPLSCPGEFRLEQFAVRTVPPWEALGRAFFGKMHLLVKYQCVGPALLRGLGLLARGRFGELASKFYKGLQGNAANLTGEYSADAAYQTWRENRQPPAVVDLPNPPRLTILMPVGDIAESLLRRAIDSVLAQTYDHWQLLLVAKSSPLLEAYAAREPRVLLQPGDLNAALDRAQGEYITRLDPCDVLAPHALASLAAALADRSLDGVYSDEDRIDAIGRHSDPFFKPSWSPEYLLGSDYPCRLGAYRTALVRDVGGYRPEVGPALDYDLVLRLSARTQKIGHVPDVLVHVGAEASTAGMAAALSSWLTMTGRAGSVEEAGLPRVRFAVRGTPKVSIVIPTGAKRAMLHGRETWFVARCVETIREQTRYGHVEVLALYNEHIDADLERQLRGHDVRLINYDRSGPFNLADKMNFGASLATGEHLVFLNDDIEVLTPDWLEAMLEYSQDDDVGAVGAKLLFPTGRLQHGGVVVISRSPMHAFHAYPPLHAGYFHSLVVPRNWLAVTGACLMTRAELFRELGGFDVAFPLNFNDVDYCLRARAKGKRSVFTPHARLVHHESVTKVGHFASELVKFQQRWGEQYPDDPYYNPNFNQTAVDCPIDPLAPRRGVRA